MNKQLETLQKRVKHILPGFVLEFQLSNDDFRTFKIVDSAGIALSVIILQAFISTGITGPYAFDSTLCFAIAIPMLAMFMYISSTMEDDLNAMASTALYLFQLIGAIVCGLGIMLAFYHLSLILGNVFGITGIISSILIILFRILGRNRKSQGIDD